MTHDPWLPTHEPGQPLSTTERSIAELWKEALQTAELPRATDDFFSLGGDSMAMVMIEYQIREMFSIELSPGAVLGAPTLREFSSMVDATRSSWLSPDTPMDDGAPKEPRTASRGET